MGTGTLTPGVKWLGREAEASPASRVDVEMHGAIRLHGVVLN